MIGQQHHVVNTYQKVSRLQVELQLPSLVPERTNDNSAPAGTRIGTVGTGTWYYSTAVPTGTWSTSICVPTLGNVSTRWAEGVPTLL